MIGIEQPPLEYQYHPTPFPPPLPGHPVKTPCHSFEVFNSDMSTLVLLYHATTFQAMGLDYATFTPHCGTRPAFNKIGILLKIFIREYIWKSTHI